MVPSMMMMMMTIGDFTFECLDNVLRFKYKLFSVLLTDSFTENLDKYYQRNLIAVRRKGCAG